MGSDDRTNMVIISVFDAVDIVHVIRVMTPLQIFICPILEMCRTFVCIRTDVQLKQPFARWAFSPTFGTCSLTDVAALQNAAALYLAKLKNLVFFLRESAFHHNFMTANTNNFNQLIAFFRITIFSAVLIAFVQARGIKPLAWLCAESILHKCAAFHRETPFSTATPRRPSDVCIFGDMMTRISITFQIGIIYYPNSYLANTKLLNLMIKYCVGSLETLRFQFCRQLLWDQISGEETLFRDLKEFELIECDYTCDRFAKHVTQVTKLSINGGSFEPYLENSRRAH